MNKQIRTWAALVVAVVCPCVGKCGIFYDAKRNLVWITDFSENHPCTLRQVRAADVQGGWGVMQHDEKRNIYTLSANLNIGSNDGSETHFHIGVPGQLPETLRMCGNVTVKPFWMAGKNAGADPRQGRAADSAQSRINRLRLGGGPSEGRLLFDMERPEQYGLTIGAEEGAGGQLVMKGGVIGVFDPDRKYHFRFFYGGDTLLLDSARLEWFCELRGVERSNRGKYEIVDTHFACGKFGLLNGNNVLTRCTFTGFDTALKDSGGLNAQMYDCLFHDNAHNWELRFTADGVTATNCEIGKPREGNIFGISERVVNGKTEMRRPAVSVRQYAIVEVHDAQGEPVVGAAIRVQSEQNFPAGISNGNAVTDGMGKSPGDAKAITLTESVERAADTGNSAETIFHTYAVSVKADGYTEISKSGIRPSAWKTIRVTLSRRR